MALQPEASNRAIAEAIGVSHVTVANDMSAGKNLPDETTISSEREEGPGNHLPPEPAAEEAEADEWDDEDEAGEAVDPRAIWRRWQEAYPEFVHPAIPPEDFTTIAEALDALPEARRLELRQRWAKRDLNALAELLGEVPIPEPDPMEVMGLRAATRWDKYFYELCTLAVSIKQDWAGLMQHWPPSVKQSALRQAREWQAIITEWVSALEQEAQEAAPTAP